MSPQNPFFAFAILCIAFISTFITRKTTAQSEAPLRYEGIEGLRGFLAISVFIHHAAIWYNFIQTGFWLKPPGNFYNQLGRVGVTMFFMITSFLFTDKLLNSGRTMDWGQYFRSRIRRLVPMFYVALTLQLLLIMAACNWTIVVSPATFAKSIFHWLCFTYFQSPTINNYGFTSLSAAGVVWSLSFELLFYFSLPIIAFVLLRKSVPVIYLLISGLMVFAFIYLNHLKAVNVYPFLGGAIAPILMKYTPIKRVAPHPLFSIIIVLCGCGLGFFYDTLTWPPMMLTVIIFTLIACGNSIFGLLRNKTLKLMGDIGYSTYLLHGMLLFSVMFFGIGYQCAKQLTPTEYCLIIAALTPILVIISYCGFKFIEQPFMEKKAIKRIANR